MIFLLQLAVMLATAALGGAIARRLKLPAVIGELFGGIVLGPTVIGRLMPGFEAWLFPTSGTIAFARTIVAKAGVIAFLFVAGLEVNLRDVRRNARAVALTSLGGILLPFGAAQLAVRLAPSLWRQSLDTDRLALFMGAAMAISALPVIARIIFDLGLERLPLAAVVLASATIDDLLGWSLFAVVLTTLAPAKSLPVTILTPAVFAAGALMSRRLETNKRVRQIATRILAPLFFVSLGLGADFMSGFDWRLVAVVIVIACAGKIAGATLGALLGGLPLRQAVAIGMAMNARGAVEMVLASIALEAKLIDTRMFVALVVMAVVTSAIAGPFMRATLAEPATT